MGKMRKVWRARFTQFRAGIRHTYTDNTMTGTQYTVDVGLVISEPGHAQYGRELLVQMRPEQALLYADSIRLRAEQAAELNRNL